MIYMLKYVNSTISRTLEVLSVFIGLLLFLLPIERQFSLNFLGAFSKFVLRCIVNKSITICHFYDKSNCRL